MRLRLKSKAPVSVAGILSVPLFFVALMAFSLRIDKPTHSLSAAGHVLYGDPTKGTVGTIYALSFAVAIGIVLVGVLASLLRSRLATIIPASAAIVATLLLFIPLATWAAGHTARYPLGTDNIGDWKPQNVMYRGAWEQSAVTTAHQIGWVTIGLAAAAIVLSLVFARRRPGPVITGTPIEVMEAPSAGGGLSGL
jgi:hypothetical protein